MEQRQAANQLHSISGEDRWARVRLFDWRMSAGNPSVTRGDSVVMLPWLIIGFNPYCFKSDKESCSCNWTVVCTIVLQRYSRFISEVNISDLFIVCPQ